MQAVCFGGLRLWLCAAIAAGVLLPASLAGQNPEPTTLPPDEGGRILSMGQPPIHKWHLGITAGAHASGIKRRAARREGLMGSWRCRWMGVRLCTPEAMRPMTGSGPATPISNCPGIAAVRPGEACHWRRRRTNSTRCWPNQAMRMTQRTIFD